MDELPIPKDMIDRCTYSQDASNVGISLKKYGPSGTVGLDSEV
jgi:hypothetical protein